MELFEGINLFIQYVYLASAALFIFGIKLLGSPATARRGNLFAALGMFIAIVATLVNEEVLNYEMIAIGIAIGAVIGAVLARTIKMTAMPQMVAIFNGVGGGASAIIAVSEFVRISGGDIASPSTSSSPSCWACSSASSPSRAASSPSASCRT